LQQKGIGVQVSNTFNEEKFSAEIDAIKLEFKEKIDRFYIFADKLFGADNVETARNETEKVLALFLQKIIVSFETDNPESEIKEKLHSSIKNWTKTNLLLKDPFDLYEIQTGLDFLVDILVTKLYAQLPIIEADAAIIGNESGNAAAV
jgi:hypothetical protein